MHGKHRYWPRAFVRKSLAKSFLHNSIPIPTLKIQRFDWYAIAHQPSQFILFATASKIPYTKNLPVQLPQRESPVRISLPEFKGKLSGLLDEVPNVAKRNLRCDLWRVVFFFFSYFVTTCYYDEYQAVLAIFRRKLCLWHSTPWIWIAREFDASLLTINAETSIFSFLNWSLAKHGVTKSPLKPQVRRSVILQSEVQ